MATDTEQLVVLLEARIRDFEKNMAKASQTAQRDFGAIERRGQQSARRLQGLFGDIGSSIKTSLSGIGGGFLAGGLAGLVSEQTLRAVGQVVKSVADMADEAARIGLAVEDFQSLTFAARQSGVEADKITDLMQKFNVEIGEAATKGNDLSRILAANNIPLLDTNGKLRTTKELFYDIANLIKNAKTQQEAALVAMTAFGRGAGDALPFLQQGADAIRDGEQAARDAGAVISQELVAKAQEFDDAWTRIWDTWTAKGKGAVIEVLAEVESLWGSIDELVNRSGLKSDSLRGSGIFPGLNEQQIKELEWLFPALKGDAKRDSLGLEREQLELVAKRAEIEKHIAELKANDAAPIEVEEYQDRLTVVLGQLEAVRQKLEAIKNLQGPSFETHGRGGVPSPVTATPELAGAATDLKNAAQSLSKATTGGILDLIGLAEGTDKGRGYNETLGYGAFTGGDVNLVTMQLRDILALQTRMLQHPDNTFNSSAVGRYQITKRTLEGLIGELGLGLDDQFTPALQDQLASALVARRGTNPDALRNEWEGLRSVGDADIFAAMGNSSGTIERGTQAINARKEATDRLIGSQHEENDALRTEAQAMQLPMFEAAKLRKEQELLNQAKRSSIPVTDQVKASISALATEYARGQVAIERVRLSQERAAQTAEQFRLAQQRAAQIGQQFEGAFGGAFKGFISDLMRGEDAANALKNALSGLAEQLMSMAVDQIFGGLFSGGGGAKAKAVSGPGLFSMLGFADGGYVRGPGTGRSDSIPVAVSNGEYIVNAEATSKHKALLDAINSGKVGKFASGGMVGAPRLPSAPALTPASANGGPTINLANTVNVNATGGTKEANEDMAKQISVHVEKSVRSIVISELMTQRRPGNMLNRI